MAKGQVKIIFNYFHCRISSDRRALTEEREVGGRGSIPGAGPNTQGLKYNREMKVTTFALQMATTWQG